MRLMFIPGFCIAGIGGAFAQSPNIETQAFTLEGGAAIVSDYRFRGWSLSGEGPALQADATLTHSSGLYVGVFASTIEEYGADADGDGAEVEINVFAGWGFSLAGFDIDAGAQLYIYPDAGGANYVVLPVSLTRSFGKWSVTTGYEYTPSQQALGDVDGSYVWLGADWASETFPLWFGGAIGHEEGGWAPDGKTDWSVGAFHSLGPFELGLTYTDTDEAAAGSAVVGEIRAPF